MGCLRFAEERDDKVNAVDTTSASAWHHPVLICQKGDLKMPPSTIQRATSVTFIGTSPSSSVLNWLEGTITEIDFNSVPVGTVIDTHYAAEGVTFELVDNNGFRIGSVVTTVGPAVNNPAGGAPIPNPDPNDPEGSASKVIGGLDDKIGIIRATFKHPQLYVGIDVIPGVVSPESTEPDPASVPFLRILGIPPVLLPHRTAHFRHDLIPVLGTLNFPLSTMDVNFESWRRMDFLSTSATPNISGVEFSGHFAGSGSTVNAYFDLLRFAHHLPLGPIDEVG
jgi:hypothetical protein